MNKQMKTAIWAASKEPLRLLAIALIPILLVMLEKISAEWAGILIVLFRFLDKLLYKVGEVRKDPVMTGGLVRF